jgi:hypothetical protein
MFAFGCATASTAQALAQGSQESQNVHLRNDCRLAAQTLTKGHPAPKTDWALSIISFCDASGGAALQAAWVTPTTDSVALEQLVAASSRLLDQRVYDGVAAAARNVAAPRTVRLAALRVLAAFVDNFTLIVADDLTRWGGDTTVHKQFSRVSEGMGQTVGSQPLAASVGTDVRALFATLGQADSDPIVRRACRSLQRWFSIY